MLTKTLIFAQSALIAALAASAAAQAPTTLKDAYKNDFPIGAAINAAQISGSDARGDAILKEQFNSISPENALKWERIHPQPGKYDFTLADQYVALGQEFHLFTVGHCLVWHNQVPGWVFRDDKGNLLGREALLARLREHIQTVVGRYKGKIQSWDVVNEALNDDGTLRPSMWLKIIGPDYIEKAFAYAHEADPAAQLTYNDYNIEFAAKQAGAIALVKKLKAGGIPIAVVGIQAHLQPDSPTAEQEDAAITAFAALGVKVAISELDINILPLPGHGPTADVTLKLAQDPALNPYAKGLPEEAQQKIADRYQALFQVFAKHRADLQRVTFWGISDGDSWLNDWPIAGRTNYPLLFDRNGKTKPAFDTVIRAAAYN
jgi:endo-1,4-beta-xylanase